MNTHRQKSIGKPLAHTAIAVILTLLPFAAAQAYVGPGAGLSLLGALWGVLAAIGAALLFVIMWPIRRMRRRKREANRDRAPTDAQKQSAQASEDNDKHTPHS